MARYFIKTIKKLLETNFCDEEIEDDQIESDPHDAFLIRVGCTQVFLKELNSILGYLNIEAKEYMKIENELSGISKYFYSLGRFVTEIQNNQATPNELKN